MNKKKISDILFILILVSFIITSVSGFLYYKDVVSTFSLPSIKYSPKGDTKSYILDSSDNIVQEIPINTVKKSKYFLLYSCSFLNCLRYLIIAMINQQKPPV